MSGFVLGTDAREFVQELIANTPPSNLVLWAFTVETPHGPIIGWWSAGCDLELAL